MSGGFNNADKRPQNPTDEVGLAAVMDLILIIQIGKDQISGTCNQSQNNTYGSYVNMRDQFFD
jgi:hypothetical protein